VLNTHPVPGTHEAGFVEELPLERGDGGTGLRAAMLEAGALGVHFYTAGDCGIIVSREPAGEHLSISCPDRHPTWDEIKTARYRLLPLELTFGMLLPPPEEYVNVPEHDHVFHLWEVEDERRQP
jgi:hypothetical protein